jgi:hypothetical protein
VTIAAAIASIAAVTAILIQIAPVYLHGRLPNEIEEHLSLLLIAVAAVATIVVCVAAL